MDAHRLPDGHECVFDHTQTAVAFHVHRKLLTNPRSDVGAMGQKMIDYRGRRGRTVDPCTLQCAGQEQIIGAAGPYRYRHPNHIDVGILGDGRSILHKVAAFDQDIRSAERHVCRTRRLNCEEPKVDLPGEKGRNGFPCSIERHQFGIEAVERCKISREIYRYTG